MGYPLDVASKWAKAIVAELKPFCQRIEVAGSIRRRCAQVNDVDLVAIPSDVDALVARLRRKAAMWTGGADIVSVTLDSGLQIDCFLAKPETRDLLDTEPSNWGSIMLCRTGSRFFNMAFAERCRMRGLHWNPQLGIFRNGVRMASVTEEDLFHWAGLKVVPPEKRDAEAVDSFALK